MNLPVVKSISDIRRDSKRVFERVKKQGEIVLVTKNSDKVSVIVPPEYFESLVSENEALWEELEMARSKQATRFEKSYKLSDVISGKV